MKLRHLGATGFLAPAAAGFMALGAAWLLMMMSVLAGCEKTEYSAWRQSRAKPAPAASADTPSSHAGELDNLRAENATLRGQLDELKARDTQLAKQVSELQFLVEQQEKSLRALAEAPKERDEAREQSRVLRDENARLREELRRLGGKIAELPWPATASAPATLTAPR
jgi:chromosome segregation ATPase